MKTYCVKDKRKTESVPGSERIIRTSNGRNMIYSQCAICGSGKTQFISGQRGGSIDYACGTNLRGKRAGNQRECLKSGQIRRYCLNLVDPDIAAEIAAKLTPKPKRQSMSDEKKKQYIDDIVADIKRGTRPVEPDWKNIALGEEIKRRSADQDRRGELLMKEYAKSMVKPKRKAPAKRKAPRRKRKVEEYEDDGEYLAKSLAKPNRKSERMSKKDIDDAFLALGYSGRPGPPRPPYKRRISDSGPTEKDFVGYRPSVRIQPRNRRPSF